MAILLSLSDANGIVFLLRKGYRQFERSLLSCIQTEGVRFAQSEHLFLLYKQHTLITTLKSSFSLCCSKKMTNA